MTEDWNLDMGGVHQDGRWVLLLDAFDQPHLMHWKVDDDGSVFGWTHDGGDTCDPVAWASVSGKNGEPLYP